MAILLIQFYKRLVAVCEATSPIVLDDDGDALSPPKLVRIVRGVIAAQVLNNRIEYTEMLLLL